MKEHHHDHDHTEPPSDLVLRVEAFESLLIEKGLAEPAAMTCTLARRHSAAPISTRPMANRSTFRLLSSMRRHSFSNQGLGL
jgi:hypothetical protein